MLAPALEEGVWATPIVSLLGRVSLLAASVTMRQGPLKSALLKTSITPGCVEEFHAQYGEDVLLSQIFRGQARGCCLEIGALDGIKDSTTLHFENKGWCCVLVEANPHLAQRARVNRRGPVFACAADSNVGVTDFLLVEDAEHLSTMISTEANALKLQGNGHQVKRLTVPTLLNDRLNDWYAHNEDADLLSFRRRFKEYYRQIRVRLRAEAVALLSPSIRERWRLFASNCVGHRRLEGRGSLIVLPAVQPTMCWGGFTSTPDGVGQ